MYRGLRGSALTDSHVAPFQVTQTSYHGVISVSLSFPSNSRKLVPHPAIRELIHMSYSMSADYPFSD